MGLQILKAGASGYLIKDSAMILHLCLRAIDRGVLISALHFEKVIEEYIRKAESGRRD
jgi:hypothetical protein